MFRCSIIIWYSTYIYVPINYNYVVSTHHRYCNYMYFLNHLLLSASPHRTVYCSELFVCAVWLILIAVQHIVDISNIVNWIEKIIFQLTCTGQQSHLE